MPVTRYYPVVSSTTRGANEPSAEQSASFPWGTNVTTYVNGPRYLALAPAAVTPVVTALVGWNSLAQTARQSAFIGHLHYRLGAQTIPAGTWSFAAAVTESNAAANSFYGLSIYVWRPSTSSVVGTIYDSQVQVGTEWPATTLSSLGSVSGASVTTQNGDTLIVEFWQTSTQAMGTAYLQQWRFDASSANTDFSANGQNGLNAWIDAPETLVPFSSGTTVATGFGQLTATGFEPSAIAPALVTTGLGEVLATGFEPTVTTPTRVATDTGTLVADGYAPTILVPLNVAVSPVVTRDVAVDPAVVPGESTLNLTATALRLFGVAPTVAADATITVSPTALRILSLVPSVSATADVLVPFARVTDGVFVPSVTATASVAVPVSTLRVFAIAPSPDAFIPISPSVLTLSAVAPAVSGGGGPGVIVIPRKGGDSSTSLTV